MNDENVSGVINEFVSNNLTPTKTQREYISEKYIEIRSLLSLNCFQVGSYARYTAINPVHDLDIVYPDVDLSIQKDPSHLLRGLYTKLQDGYAESSAIKRISIQSHSVTVEYADPPQDSFSIDVVPAVELSYRNEYGDPIYMVPEILRFSREKRLQLYKMAATHPIQWIKSDPRGYIKAASILNEDNGDFRHAVKLLKGWRHSCRESYGDSFKLKSFHLEQICYRYFMENHGSITLNSIIDCLGDIPQCLEKPQFPDRANPDRFIDEYIEKLDPDEKRLILRSQSKAFNIARLLPTAATPQDVTERLESFLSPDKESAKVFAPATIAIAAKQPWAF